MREIYVRGKKEQKRGKGEKCLFISISTFPKGRALFGILGKGRNWLGSRVLDMRMAVFHVAGFEIWLVFWLFHILVL